MSRISLLLPAPVSRGYRHLQEDSSREEELCSTEYLHSIMLLQTRLLRCIAGGSSVVFTQTSKQYYCVQSESLQQLSTLQWCNSRG